MPGTQEAFSRKLVGGGEKCQNEHSVKRQQEHEEKVV